MLAWLRHRPVPVLPVLGARKVSHLHDNLASLDFNLSVEQVKALDEARSIEPVQRNKTMTRALAYGGMRKGVVA